MAQTPSTTNYAEIQENELQVLRSIYMEDFEEDKTKAGAWNKKADKSFAISLRAPSDPSDDIKCILKVKFPATYPKGLPQLSVSFSNGVSAKTRKAIEMLIKTKPKELLGQESIFEVATSIQESLDDAVANMARTEGLPTLNEERALKEREAQRKANDMKAEEEQRQKEAEDEETRNLSEMVDRERARLSRLQMKQEETAETVEADHEGTAAVTFDQEMKTRASNGTVVAFRSIIRRAKYRNGPVTAVTTACTVDSGEDCLPCLVLKECIISTSGSAESMKKRIQALEVDLDNLVRLPNHAAVLKPLGFRIEKSLSSSQPSPGKWRIQVLMDFMPRGSLTDLLENVGTLEIRTTRTWIVQILEGLDFLHRHHVAHGRLTANNVLLERSASGETTLKLADFLYQQDLYNLQDASTKFSTAPSAYWLCPETANKDSLKSTSPRDIWDFGIVILQMFWGLEIQRQYQSPSSLLESNSLSETFEIFINKFFKADPKKRPSAFELLPDAFLRSDDLILDNMTSSVLSRVISLQSPTKPMRPRRESANFRIGVSRYATDFVELGRLGKGGFGEVVKARNKLDGTIYAVKKIIQTSASALSGVLSEVMLLSRLNNPFIVRYYTAWIEEDEDAGQPKEDSDSSTDDESSDLLSHLPDSTTRGLDFISSGGYGGIEFGYDTDDDESHSQVLSDDEDEDDESVSPEVKNTRSNKRASRRRSSVGRNLPVKLFIQMEYCEKQTLRDLIRSDLYKDVDEIWRLLHQVLQGLAHIHQNGVIHRDLKPENVFIDQSNTVRIGDFGLARPGQTSQKLSSNGFVAPDLTASIGTSVYVAPEVRSSSGGNYNEKADMYSLGIILFEMSWPLTTGMERARTLDSLRQEPPEFPPAFEEPEKALQKEIIGSLVRHKVSQRPSSQELLRSGKIPSQVEDEAVQAALQSLSDKSSPFFAKLISSLFDPTSIGDSRTAKDYTYDLQVGLKTEIADLLIQSFVKDQLINVFRRHGAVETQRPQLLPSSNHYADEAARFLDSSGMQVQLPFDLTLPFARMLAKRPDLASCRKSFCFANVFRNAAAGTHPYVHAAVDFDIVSNDSFDMALREAEAIKVVDEILESVPSMRSVPVYYQISHSKILDRILGSVPVEKRQAVKQAISKLYTGGWTWAKIRNELRSPPTSVSSTVIDDLMQFDFREPCGQVVAKLRNLLRETDELESTFRHLDAVVTYTERFKVKRKVFVYPLASLNEQFYRGNMLFQGLLDGKKKKSVLCAGGRYDRLIQEQRAGSKAPTAHAVGFSLAWEILIESTSRYQNTPGKKFLKKSEEVNDAPAKIRRCDVLIDSGDPSILRSSGIQLAQELWDNGISAELVIDSGIREATSQHQANKDEATSHDWLVLIKQDETVKVRSMITKEETELRRAELSGWLRSEMRERERLEGKASKARAAHQSSSHQDHSGGHELDVKVLISQSRSKKTNRRSIVDDAQARAQEVAQGFLDAPVAAVEIRDDLFDALRDTRLADPESWRRFVQSAPLADRTYLGDLHKLLLDMAEERKGKERNAWVYNFRSKACMLYDLGRAP